MSPHPRHRVAYVIGTRPEAIKMAPLVLATRDHAELEPVLIDTGQHPDLVSGALAPFGLGADRTLQTVRTGDAVAVLTSRIVETLVPVLRSADVDAVVVQGDTATTVAGALTAFWERLPVVHLEAGLRSGDLASPFPEEGHRRMVAPLASLHLAPTAGAAASLLAEGVPPAAIATIGNTAIDAVLLAAGGLVPERDRCSSRHVLVTAHRRESWGAGLDAVLEAVATLAARHRGHRFVFPAHPNPAIGRAARTALGHLGNVEVRGPLDYGAFAPLLASCRLVLTDSGGIQEEAPVLGVPVLVLRGVTERPEGVRTGAAELVGLDPSRIVASASRLLTDDDAWRRMARAPNPYGDGRAARRAADAITRLLGREHSDRIEPPAPAVAPTMSRS